MCSFRIWKNQMKPQLGFCENWEIGPDWPYNCVMVKVNPTPYFEGVIRQSDIWTVNTTRWPLSFGLFFIQPNDVENTHPCRALTNRKSAIGQISPISLIITQLIENSILRFLAQTASKNIEISNFYRSSTKSFKVHYLMLNVKCFLYGISLEQRDG